MKTRLNSVWRKFGKCSVGIALTAMILAVGLVPYDSVKALQWKFVTSGFDSNLQFVSNATAYAVGATNGVNGAGGTHATANLIPIDPNSVQMCFNAQLLTTNISGAASNYTFKINFTPDGTNWPSTNQFSFSYQTTVAWQSNATITNVVTGVNFFVPSSNYAGCRYGALDAVVTTQTNTVQLLSFTVTDNN